MSGIVLLGGGGHASDVLSVVEALLRTGRRDLEPVYVADDAWTRPDRFEGRCDLKMIESIEAAARLAPFAIAVGYPAHRRAVYEVANSLGGRPVEPLVHPDASVDGVSWLGPGAVVMGQVWLSPWARIGSHAHVGYGATVGHDTAIGPFASVMPGAAIGGDVSIGEGVLVGANATVLQGLTIGEGAVIGAGAVVVGDVGPDVTVVGVPARATRQEG